jgi:hypothetical protein
MPRLIESLKKQAVDRAVVNGHNLSKFQRVQGGEEVHMASCKDCGATVEIVDGGIGGTAIIKVCGNDMEEEMEVIAMKTEPIKEGDGVMFGTVTTQEIAEHGGSLLAEDYLPTSDTQLSQEDQVALAELLIDPPPPNDAMKRAFKKRGVDYQEDAPRTKRAKLPLHYVAGKKFPSYREPKKREPKQRVKARNVGFPDGSIYEARSSGWIRTTSRKCEDKEYAFHNNSTRRRLA